jgi:RNA polymerase-binding transcription factor DksA
MVPLHSTPSFRSQSRRDRLRVDARWAWHYRTLMALREHMILEQRFPEAADKFDRDFIQALLAHEDDPLGEINAALERILHGEYGVCELTGQRIKPERLRAAPWTRRRTD